MNILIFDGVCPKSYDLNTFKVEALGGTEATVLRVAERFSLLHNVTVCQHNRRSDLDYSPSLRFTRMESYTDKPDVVICLREPGYIKDLREHFPDAKMYLWAHDLPSAKFAEYALSLHNTNTTVVAVSNWHREVIEDAFTQAGHPRVALVKYIYNPIDDTLGPITRSYDPFKLCFISSPHKGLERTVDAVRVLRMRDARYQLHIANPGYFNDANIEWPGFINHGQLTHPELMRMVSDAVGVLHCNNVFPETFGIVHAEANALGVPFLTDFNNGASQELTDHPQELIDVNNTEAICARIQAWSEGRRPIVRANPMFRLSRVVDEWYSLIRGTR